MKSGLAPLKRKACHKAGAWHEPDDRALGLLHISRDAVEEVIVAAHHRRHRLELVSDRSRIVLDRGLSSDGLARRRWRILMALADRGGSASCGSVQAGCAGRQRHDDPGAADSG